MRPVKTVSSNFVYRGPASDIGDAWVERQPQERAVYLVWQLSDYERESIALGAQIKLGIFNMEPIPPVSLNVTDEEVITDANPGHRIRQPEAQGFA